jgi:hypothetical protein
MTLNSNWPGRTCPAGNRPAAQQLHKQLHREQRRWHLLAALHGLPERVWIASRRYFSWLSQQWWEAAANTDRVEELLAHGQHSIGVGGEEWLAFALGGARAYVQTYDFAPGSAADFLVGSLYVNDLSFTAEDIRELRHRVIALNFLRPASYNESQRTGEQSAAFWLDQAQKRELPNGKWRQPPPPLECQPAGYTDLLELKMALGHRAIH